MADINIFRSKTTSTAWMIAETHIGEKWMRKQFASITQNIGKVEVESFVRAAQQEELTVEVY